MAEALSLAIAFAAGFLLGAVFFCGLWWTIQKGLSSKKPALWFLGSLLLRVIITLAGFYLFADGQWERLVTCLVGFVTARLFVVQLTRSCGNRTPSRAMEGSHAP